MFWDVVNWPLLIRISCVLIYPIMKQLNELLHVVAGKKVRELCFLDDDYTAHELSIDKLHCVVNNISLRVVAVLSDQRSLVERSHNARGC